MVLRSYRLSLVVAVVALTAATSGGRAQGEEEQKISLSADQLPPVAEDVSSDNLRRHGRKQETMERALKGGMCPEISDAENNDHPQPLFPHTLQGSFTLITEMTLREEKKTLYVEEVREVVELPVRSVRVNLGQVRVVEGGLETVYYYHPEVGLWVQQRDGLCNVTGTEEPPFNPWGWWDPNPPEGQMLYGPSSILRQTLFTNKKFIGTHVIDSKMETERWETCVDNRTVSVIYYFSGRRWNMAEASHFEEGDGRMPVRIEVILLDPVARVEYNILSFTPTLPNPPLAETPRGLSCDGNVSIAPEAEFPILYHRFSFLQEVVQNSSIDGADLDHHTQSVSRVKVTYSQPLALLRYDYTDPSPGYPYYSAGPVKVVHDYNTGAQYVTDLARGNCSVRRIKDNMFDNGHGGLFGTGGLFPDPYQLFRLDDSFAMVGPREVRGARTWLWTSTRRDIPDPDTEGLQNYPKAALEYYFVREILTLDNEIHVLNVPLQADLFVYNISDQSQVAGMTTTNIYDFNLVELNTVDEFSVEACFDDWRNEWSYFFIAFPANQDLQMGVSMEIDRFKSDLFALLVETSKISPTRIAAIDVTVGIPGPFRTSHNAADVVLANVKVLMKALYILSYTEPLDDPRPVPGDKEVVVQGTVTSASHCATLCSTYTDFPCKAFHHCGETCYLSRVKGTDGEPDYTVGGCSLWVLNLPNATLLDLPTDQAFRVLSLVIGAHAFSIQVPNGLSGHDVPLLATAALHVTNPDPQSALRSQFTLQARDTALRYPSHTLHQTESLEQCLKRCVNWQEYRCESLSYAWHRSECLLSAAHVDELNNTHLVPDTDSDTYSRSYLSDYSPVIGGVAINSSGPVHTGVPNFDSCARLCTTEETIDCQSFEYCIEDQLCRLHEEHFLDVVDDGNYLNDTICLHFSTKSDKVFSQYTSQGLPEDRHASLIAADTDSTACAKLCLDKMDEVCQSFDVCSACEEGDWAVCGEENKGGAGLCFLSLHHLGEPGLKLLSAPHCTHFSRDYFGDLDYPAWVAKYSKNDKIYTSADMVGLGFGSSLLGFVATVIFLVVLVRCSPPAPSQPAPQTPKGEEEGPEARIDLSYVSLKTVAEESET